MSMWELIRWFSSFFSPLSEGWGCGGIARSTRLSGKRFCGDRQRNRKGGGGSLAMGHWALLIPKERSVRSCYRHANNRICFVATLIPPCSFKLSTRVTITHLPHVTVFNQSISKFSAILIITQRLFIKSKLHVFAGTSISYDSTATCSSINSEVRVQGDANTSNLTSKILYTQRKAH